jgi:uncharacterized Zn-finger protein
MAIYKGLEIKAGIQLGTVGDICDQCIKNHRGEEDYEPQQLEYQEVYKYWVNNLSHCLCMDCFKKSLGDNYILILTQNSEDIEEIPEQQVEEKPKQNKNKNKNKKEEGEE